MEKMTCITYFPALPISGTDQKNTAVKQCQCISRVFSKTNDWSTYNQEANSWLAGSKIKKQPTKITECTFNCISSF